MAKKKYRRTRIEIVVQNSDQGAESYRNELQGMMDEVNLRPTTFTPAICIPSASSTGRMTTMIQWQEHADRPVVKRTPKDDDQLIKEGRVINPKKRRIN